MGVGLYAFVPEYILEAADALMEKMHKESGEPGDPPPKLTKLHKGVLAHCVIV